MACLLDRQGTVNLHRTFDTLLKRRRDVDTDMRDVVVCHEDVYKRQVLNMSRGGIVNEKDMYEALKAGKIGGYAADVMENELAGSGLTGDDTFASPLFECDNFIVSPHIGAQSVDASRDIGLHIISKVKEALSL